MPTEENLRRVSEKPGEGGRRGASGHRLVDDDHLLLGASDGEGLPPQGELPDDRVHELFELVAGGACVVPRSQAVEVVVRLQFGDESRGPRAAWVGFGAQGRGGLGGDLGPVREQPAGPGIEERGRGFTPRRSS